MVFPVVMYGSDKALAPHSSTLAWKIPWTEEPGRLQSMGSLGIRHDWATSLSCTGEGNGNPLQSSCLENPRDGKAWWAAIYGVAQSQTQLKWLSSSSSRLYVVCQDSLSMEFSRKEYWSKLPFPTPGINPGIKPSHILYCLKPSPHDYVTCLILVSIKIKLRCINIHLQTPCLHDMKFTVDLINPLVKFL